jgi:GT2 family glycosyltransferase
VLATLTRHAEWRAGLPGVSAGAERRHFNRRYEEYLARVEPELAQREARAGSLPISLRGVVLPSPSGLGPCDAVGYSGLAATLCGFPPDSAGPGVEVLNGETAGRGLLDLLNDGLRTWNEDWLILLRPSDSPSPALRESMAAFLAASRQEPSAVVVDDDRLDAAGRRVDPRFKPGFSPEWLIENDYVGRGVVFNRRRLLDLGGFEGPPEHFVRATLWKVFLEGGHIAKLDRVLLHVDGTAAEPEEPAQDAEFAHRALARRGLLERGEVRELAYGVEVRYALAPSALVSIVIVFTDKPDLLRQCLDSIHRSTTHPRYELILVSTRSREPATHEYLEELGGDPRIRILYLDESFNYSRANNLGAEAAGGEYLVFLNNDTRLLTPEWLDELCGFAGLADIGAVGAKLLLADGSLQHAGVVVGMGGYAKHLFLGQHEPFVPPEWIRHTRNCSAVTAACLAIERRKFLECGGFDERLTLTGNDVELCLRLLKRGLRNVFVPSVVLFHYEQSTRRRDRVAEHNKRFSLYTYRDLFLSGDPYYNTNLDLATTDLLPKTAVVPAGARSPALAPANPFDASIRFLRRYDLGRHELAANRATLATFAGNRRIVPEAITWFVPHFDHVYRGGIHTVMRIADHFSRRCGALNRFVFYGRGRGDLEGMDRQIGTAFPALRRKLILLRPDDHEDDLPPSDIAFCTLWTSAYHLARYNRCAGKFYLVQDFEGGFSRDNSVDALAEETYRFGFAGVANTPGVCEMYRSYGNEAEFFVPAVDREIYSPIRMELPDDVFRVVVYGRPDKPRNAFALAVESLRELKRRQGDRVEILSAGAEFDVAEYGLEGVLVNLGLLPDMHAVASLYRNAHVGLVFMLSRHPSYQPFEYMASGCAVVTNVNEANSWLLHDRENALVVPPLRTAVVEAIEELMEDSPLRRRLIRGGLATVSRTDWEHELEVVYRFVTEGASREALSLSPQRFGQRSLA